MIETDKQKRLLKLLREARRKESDQNVRLVRMMGGVAFVRNRDYEQQNKPYDGLWPYFSH